jgi:hypothetical protein
MDSFYFIILAIAIVILILVLAVIGWMMTKNVQSQKFPGITTTCPDFWTIDGTGKCVRPNAGERNRGLASLDSVISDKTKTPGGAANSFDSNDAGWSANGDPICMKKKWATTYGVNWDTVTNSNAVC